MPGEMTTPNQEESLFSLELVVEKVYVPHTPCRFPAVVFRLLDFPTILINHVEKDLEKAIRRKISVDPHYHLPDQFSELKDRHGNFMVKKGKSCLFKISADILKQHLASTPLYVMVIDQFPEIPKLIGNSTVPLNSLMDSICIDIANLGATVPSVHGDKGLFKLYNLMGKEIGYFVLGFRLLCLGPSLIPHLPASALMQRHGPQKKGMKQFEEMLQTSQMEEEESDEPEIELRNSACMTDPIKHDVLLQTVEMDDKAVHVEVGGIETQTQTNFVQGKESSTMATQTEKRKRIKEALNTKQKWVEKMEHKVDDDDVIINNIVCPPPLFYNSEAAPSIEIERQRQHSLRSLQDEISVEDLSDIESYDGQGLEKPKISRSFASDMEPEPYVVSKPLQMRQDPKQAHRSVPSGPIPQARAGEFIQGLQVAPNADAVFPLLTALINELSCIQDPQLLLNVSNRIQATRPRQAFAQKEDERTTRMHREDKISPSVVSAVAAALTKKFENSNDNITGPGRQPEKAPSAQDMRKDKSQKQANLSKASTSSAAKKNNKLVFGLTNTQRLRLQKTNPAWLKQAEQQAEKGKSQKQPAVKQMPLDEMNATTFSDTLTEVRRLAEKELESTAGGDTLLHIASEVEEMNSTFGTTRENSRKPLKKQQSPGGGPSKSKSREFSPQSKPRRNAPLPKARTRLRQRRESQQNNMKDSSDSDEMAQKRPVPLERHMRNITSPVVPDHDAGVGEIEEGLSARSDLPSSRSRSIEVHLPSAQPDFNDSDAITDAEEDEVDIPLPDESLKEQQRPQSVNLPQYISKDMSLPDPIDGVPNASLNVSGALDDNSPLESTRHSKNITEEQNDSRVLQSTDYDTRQFHSTDEPELQGLMSDEENRSGAGDSSRRSANSLRTSQKFPVINPQLSENSPVPSVRRSTTKLDAGAHSYLPSMSLSKGQVSPVSSRPGTPKGRNPELLPINPKGGVITPRSNITPRSMSPSPKRPTPRQKKALRDYRESIHTESLSSYMPSDPENMIVSLSSNSGGNYSDDFQPLGSGESAEATSSVEQLPKIASSKLGYTIG